MEEKNKCGAIFPHMVAIMKAVKPIGKASYNKIQHFSFRGIDDIYNSVQEILADNNVFMTSEVLSHDRVERSSKGGGVLAFTCLHIKYNFYAEDGSSVSTESYGEGMDSGDKSSPKAMSIAQKYALIQAFCIPTADLVDPDAESPQLAQDNASKSNEPQSEVTISVPQYRTLCEKIDEAEANPVVVAEYFGVLPKDSGKSAMEAVDAIGKLPARLFTNAMAVMEKSINKKKNVNHTNEQEGANNG